MEFYPTDARVPEEKRTERILLRPLRETDVDLDYDAVMSSAEMLRRWSGSEWPRDDFTLEQNRADLERHEREHHERQAFTFTVTNLQQNKCLGCVYIQPRLPDEREACADAAFATNVGFWVRASELARDLDEHLFITLREWLREEWAFDCVLFAIRPEETRQAEIFKAMGLELERIVTTRDGQQELVFR